MRACVREKGKFFESNKKENSFVRVKPFLVFCFLIEKRQIQGLCKLKKLNFFWGGGKERKGREVRAVKSIFLIVSHGFIIIIIAGEGGVAKYKHDDFKAFLFFCFSMLKR